MIHREHQLSNPAWVPSCIPPSAMIPSMLPVINPSHGQVKPRGHSASSQGCARPVKVYLSWKERIKALAYREAGMGEWIIGLIARAWLLACVVFAAVVTSSLSRSSRAVIAAGQGTRPRKSPPAPCS